MKFFPRLATNQDLSEIRVQYMEKLIRGENSKYARQDLEREYGGRLVEIALRLSRS
jgi:hypothetical protein